MDDMTRLENIVALSSRMLLAAKNGRWEEAQFLAHQECEQAGLFRARAGVSVAESEKQLKLIQEALENHSTISEFALPLWQDIKILLESFQEELRIEK